MVTVVGLSVLTRLGDALSEARNMVIVSTILVIGLGGLTLNFGDNFALAGIGLSGIAGLVLNLILPSSPAES